MYNGFQDGNLQGWSTVQKPWYENDCLILVSTDSVRTSLILEWCLWGLGEWGIKKSYLVKKKKKSHICKIALRCFKNILGINLPLKIDLVQNVQIHDKRETNKALLPLQTIWNNSWLFLPIWWGTHQCRAASSCTGAVTLSFLLSECHQSGNDRLGSGKHCS